MSTAVVSSTFFGDFGDHYRSNGSTALQNSSKNSYGSQLEKKSSLVSLYNSSVQNNINNNNNTTNNNNNINNSLNNNNVNAISRRLVTTSASVPINVSHSSHRLQSSTTAVPLMIHKSPVGVHNTTPLVRGLSTNASQQCSQSNNNNAINGNNNNKEHKKLDRSYSEPAEKSGQQQQLVRLNSVQTSVAGPMSSRYKTELCRSFAEVGTCKYGDKCQFAHGGHELRVITRHPKFKTENCKSFHSTGFCPYGPRCHFIHNSEESKKNMLNNLSTTGSQSGSPPNGVNTNGTQNQINLNISANNPMAGNGFGSTYHSNANSHPLRPKALSIGSYSLGSSGEISPPSSQSGSPTSLNSFFTEDPFHPFVSQSNQALGNTGANNAFSFSPDFASFVPTNNNNKSSPFGGSQPSLCSPLNPLSLNLNQDMSEPSAVVQTMFLNQFQSNTSSNITAYEQHLNEGTQAMATTPPPQPSKLTPMTPVSMSYPVAPESPVDSITSDVEALKLEQKSLSPMPTCSSPLDVSKSLPRLPIFTRFANNGNNDSE